MIRRLFWIVIGIAIALSCIAPVKAQHQTPRLWIGDHPLDLTCSQLQTQTTFLASIMYVSANRARELGCADGRDPSCFAMGVVYVEAERTLDIMTSIYKRQCRDV